MILRKFVLTLSAFALSLPVPALAQSRHLLEYPSIHSPVVGTRGMIVSQNAIASEVGAQILRDGGNAVMTVFDAKSRQVRVLVIRGVGPGAPTPAMFVDNQGKERNIASYGYMAPSVPGTVAGLEHAHRKWGKLPWAKVVEPAIRLARDGVKLTADEAFVFGWGRERLSKSASGKTTFRWQPLRQGRGAEAARPRLDAQRDREGWCQGLLYR